MSEEEKKRDLTNARTEKNHKVNFAKKVKSVAKKISPFKYVEVTDYLFIGIALSAAILKDILDFTPFGLPGINLVITFMASCTITLCMYLAGSSSSRSKTKKMFGRVFKKYGSLLGGSIIEAFAYGFDFVPLETAIVLYMYWQTLRERQESAQEEKREKAQAVSIQDNLKPAQI